MIFFKKIKEGIKTAIGMAYDERKKLSKFKKTIRAEIAENEMNRRAFQSTTKKDVNILQEDIESVAIHFALEVRNIQNNIELIANELKNSKVVKKTKKSI